MHMLDISNWVCVKDSFNIKVEKDGFIYPNHKIFYRYDPYADWREYDCISFDIQLPDESPLLLEVTAYPVKIGRPEYVEQTSANVIVAGKGWKTIEINFSQFDTNEVASAFWRFIGEVSLEARFLSGEQEGEIFFKNCRLKHSGPIDLQSEQDSLAGKTGKIVCYHFTVTNESNVTQAVSLFLEKYGWESVETKLHPHYIVLEPGERQHGTLEVEINEQIAPGGFEVQTLVAVPNGNTSFLKKIELITVKELPHPYLLHTEDGWNAVRAKIASYDWARNSLGSYVNNAEKWEVPECHTNSEFAFSLEERFPFMATAIAWKLTGRKDLLKKVSLFLKRFANPKTGYPTTKASIFHSIDELLLDGEFPLEAKVSSGKLIHEGELMMDIVSGYDLIYHTEALTEEDHVHIKQALERFIQKVDWVITDGDSNNIPAGGMVAGLFCSLVIQDMKWIRRFISGKNGFCDLIAAGVMDDDWYFESASNYVVLFADLVTKVAQACLPWGINVRDLYIPPYYGRNAMISPWTYPKEKPFLGMSFQKYGTNKKNYRSIRGIWDAMLPFIDYRGILFGANDSAEMNMAATYELAYYLYRNPSYVPVIKHAEKRDLLYGVPELPEEVETDLHTRSTFSDNVGFCVLRSQTDGREQSEQIQMVIKYGTHGGYHGHFDRASMLQLMRYGKNVYNPEATWYGYGSYMFKMWVQTSMSHNMVVVDQKMQEPSETKRLLFHTGKLFQVCAVETIARWCDPPYGGQTPYAEQFPEEKAWNEGRYIPSPPIKREQGDIGDYTEPILQRRMIMVTDDYVVIVDYVKGKELHDYDCLFHFEGLKELSATKKKWIHHTGQFTQDPYSAGQFITDCHWYNVQAPAQIHYEYDYDQKKDNEYGKNSRFNVDGHMKIDLHSIWPKQQQIMIGNFPEADEINKQLTYEIIGDGKRLDSGAFGAWILGKGIVDVSLKGIKELQIKVNVDKSSRKTIFIGEPYILTTDGKTISITELHYDLDHVDLGKGIGKDYYGGPVKIAGVEYEAAVPFEPIDCTKPAVMTLNIEKMNADRLKLVIGGDYPLGDEGKQRKTIAIRTSNNEARYINVVELYPEKPVIRGTNVIDDSCFEVELENGCIQRIEFDNFYSHEKGVRVKIIEEKRGKVTREESTIK
ncbi:heparinase II/III family protein [Halalkalibacter sp. APA_J-10(15)]|uniref:COG1470 family protein n=1 Tax=Halalkalibacter sp. APA_J-10(15) TaxID=2933805 RepID=UPI001FF2F9CD|nr:heparinase II/III family protein [Halalkalibacter sp. APA_J-10(15)]MCK0473676.1 heparinase II/III family protein [Halalkalibacter sp. APA_J-10(15)]